MTTKPQAKIIIDGRYPDPIIFDPSNKLAYDLHRAIYENDLDVVISLISTHPNLTSYKNQFTGNNALHFAVSLGNFRVVKFLSEIDTNLLFSKNTNQLSPLELAQSYLGKMNADKRTFLLNDLRSLYLRLEGIEMFFNQILETNLINELAFLKVSTTLASATAEPAYEFRDRSLMQ
jgi:ankyrin repeat protein